VKVRIAVKSYSRIITAFGVLTILYSVEANQTFSAIAQAATSAVANISTTQLIKTRQNCACPKYDLSQNYNFDELEELPSDLSEPIEKSQKVESSGSGFVIKSDQYSALIVTNYHVISDGGNISVFLSDQTELPATIHGIDDQADLAVLTVKTNHLPKDRQKLTTLEWADSENIKIGDFVLAIGNSYGMNNSTSHGIISSISRSISKPHSQRDYTLNFIQHSAPIHKGNSGGPLLNMEGKVIGINTAIFSSSGENIGIGFSIPSKIARDRIQQLIEFGRIRVGWLGLKTQNLSGEDFQGSGLDKGKNYKIVSSVSPYGPGAKAMIKPGDVILEFNGQEVTDKTSLTQVINDTPVGKAIKVKLWRSGQFLTVEAVLEELQSTPPSLPSI